MWIEDDFTGCVITPVFSLSQPFCDGAHRTKAPGISPLHFTPDKDRKFMLCACKQTRNAPYCDGSHFRVIFRDLVKSVKGIFKWIAHLNQSTPAVEIISNSIRLIVRLGWTHYILTFMAVCLLLGKCDALHRVILFILVRLTFWLYKWSDSWWSIYVL